MNRAQMKSMLCISIKPCSIDEALERMTRAGSRADLVELRLDAMTRPDLKRLLQNKPCPVIVTNRPRRQGGDFSGPEAERLQLLKQAARSGADYLDIELEALPKFARIGSTKLIVSYHDFERTPADLNQIYRKLAATGADVIKVACQANHISDNLKMFELLRNADRPTVALCMGELGEISRVRAPKFGGFLTYASLAPGAETASGQLSSSELVELYHYHDIGPDTDVYGVIGNPVAHSASPDILNAAFHQEGVDAVYVRFKVEDVVGFVEAFKVVPVKGCSVTIPHKEAVIPALDSLEETSRKIGAINTIVTRDGKLKGFNTDWLAAVGSLEEKLGGEPESALGGKRCVMVGAGGAARAIAYGLDRRGARLVILNRTENRARRLATEAGCDWRPLEELVNLEADVVINATSVGMHPQVDETPVPADFFRPGTLAFDVVYNPAETRFLREAKARGCTVVSGIDMFVGQAVAQFELWTGKPAPRGLMREVVCAKLLGS